MKKDCKNHKEEEMSDDNKRNLIFFEAPTMRALFTKMDTWQAKHRKRLASISIQPEGGAFACVALSNPTEVIIVDGLGIGGVATLFRKDVRGGSLALHTFDRDV